MKKYSLRKIMFLGVAIIFFEIAMGFVFVAFFAKESQKVFKEISEKELNDEVKDSAREFSYDLKAIYGYMERSVLAVKGRDTVLSTAEFLRDIEDNSNADLVFYFDGKNIANDSRGNTYNISTMENLESLKEGKILCVEDNIIDNRPAFLIPCVPGGYTEGGIVSVVYTELFDKNVSAEERFPYSFYAMIDKDHNTVHAVGRTGNLFLIDGDFWNKVEESAKTEEDWLRFSNGVSTGNQFVLEAVQSDVERYIAFYPVDGTDWTVLVGYDKKLVNDENDNLTGPTRAAVVEITLCLFILTVTFLTFVLMSRSSVKSNSRELTGKAETDLLTGLYNKNATEAKIREYIHSYQGSKGVFILIDVDNFKKINDTMGHAFGDEVLRNLGMRLRTLYRASDIIGRIGGDEFIVFLKDIDDRNIMEREARKLEVFFCGFEVGEYTRYSVNASLGAAIFPTDGDNFETLYKNADQALYYVKQHGKNRLAFYKSSK